MTNDMQMVGRRTLCLKNSEIDGSSQIIVNDSVDEAKAFITESVDAEAFLGHAEDFSEILFVMINAGVMES